MNEDKVQDVSNDNVLKDISSIVPPINEVKIEGTEDTIEAEQSMTSINNQPSNESPKDNKSSTILLVLLFVFLFAFVMGMPYINEFINKLKENNELSGIEKEEPDTEINPPIMNEEVKTIELICTSNTITTDNYSLIQIQKFHYNSKNEILSSEMISKYIFSLEDDTYNNLKKQCDEDSLKYLMHSGYTTACSYDSQNIEISHEFDLETFTPIIDGETNIQANATYKQDVDIVKNKLFSQGYTCE